MTEAPGKLSAIEENVQIAQFNDPEDLHSTECKVATGGEKAASIPPNFSHLHSAS